MEAIKFEQVMSLKCNKKVYIVFAAFAILGVLASLRYFNISKMEFLIFTVSVFFMSAYSVSDIDSRTVSGISLLCGIITVFVLKFIGRAFSVSYACAMIYSGKALLFLCIIKILSKIFKNKIGSADFDTAYIIFLCIGAAGLFYSFIIACLLVIIKHFSQILIKRNSFGQQSVALIPYMYLGYLITILFIRS